MTDIPGTGKLSSDSEQKETAQVISAVNVRELKRIKKEGPRPQEDLLWYNKLSFWILFGVAASGLVSLLAFINLRFLLLAPLGPTIAVCAWYVRKIVTRYEEKTKGFLK